MSKLDPKSLKCIFLGYSQVQKGYRCYCPSLQRYLVFTDVTFLENPHFSPDLIHTSQGEGDDLLIYTLASPAHTCVPPLTKDQNIGKHGYIGNWILRKYQKYW